VGSLVELLLVFRSRERSLTEAVERLELALKGTDLAMWDWDLRSGEVINDERWAAMLGYQPSEVARRIADRFELVHPDDQRELQRQLHPHLKGQTPYFEVLHRMRHKDGEWRWILDRGRVVERDADGQALRMTGTHRDVTAERRREEERRRLEEQIQEGQKLESLGVLAGGIAHDFNNLFTSLLGHATLGAAELGVSSPVRARLEAIATTTERAAELSRQLLAYAGRTNLVIEPFDLEGVITEMTQLLAVAVSKKIEIRYQLAGELPAVEGDATQIRQVLMNLVTNAAEAIGDAGGTITVSSGVVELGGADAELVTGGEEPAAGRYAFFEIADDGVGMDERTRRRIFEPFFTTKRPGRGLGLAATLGVVRSHGGALTVDSRSGEGTAIRVLLPAGEAAPKSAATVVDARPRLRGEGRILVVDDEEGVRNVARAALESAGFEVLVAGDGLEAVELLDRQGAGLDAVVLDLAMPGLGGDEVLAQMRQRGLAMPVVMSSGFMNDEVARRIPADDRLWTLAKPYRPAVLVELVRAVTERA
jgi:PAS domain S-box-containing protein